MTEERDEIDSLNRWVRNIDRLLFLLPIISIALAIWFIFLKMEKEKLTIERDSLLRQIRELDEQG